MNKPVQPPEAEPLPEWLKQIETRWERYPYLPPVALAIDENVERLLELVKAQREALDQAEGFLAAHGWRSMKQERAWLLWEGKR